MFINTDTAYLWENWALGQGMTKQETLRGKVTVLKHSIYCI